MENYGEISGINDREWNCGVVCNKCGNKVPGSINNQRLMTSGPEKG
jgi:hypothetical protein